MKKQNFKRQEQTKAEMVDIDPATIFPSSPLFQDCSPVLLINEETKSKMVESVNSPNSCAPCRQKAGMFRTDREQEEYLKKGLERRLP